MEKITFECEVITPMFLAGADGSTPELRPPSIKGALRFWWRAMHGHLPLAELKRLEGEIFGDTSRRSRFSISVIPKNIELGKQKPVAHKRYVFPCMMPQSTFEVTFRIPNKDETKWGMEKCSNLFELVTILGGFGKRVRRGMGCVDIVKCSNENWRKQDNSLEHIYNLIKTFSNHYTLRDNSIYINFSGGMQYYPWIRQIELGEHNPNILEDISDTTHSLHANNNQRVYEASLGHAKGGRFASPIYVSVAKGSTKPVITTLNPIPDRSGRDISSRLQDEFKDRILNP
jgi:CRISPR-associated protein Cmr1